jgi:hypothetical protein
MVDVANCEVSHPAGRPARFELAECEEGQVDLKPGTRWASQVCDTEVVVVRAGTSVVSLECGGHAMIPVGDAPAPGLAVDPSFSEGTLIGKRFADPDSGVELLVTKAGVGTLAVDGTRIPAKDAKPLPSSD